MTRRNWLHSTIEMNVGHLLKLWLRERPAPRGRVVGGEAGFRLGTGSMVGLDVAYVSPELAAATPRSKAFFEGAPTIAIEILSPSDKQEDVDDKIDTYLKSGVPLIWIIQPGFSTVTVYRPDDVPKLYTIRDEITTEPHLPGFRAAISEIFEDC